MRALVTGGTGFIGSNLAGRLIREGWGVTITGRKGEQEIPELKNPVVEGDLGKIEWHKLGRFDAVFHQAAITDTLVTDEKEMMRVNCEEARRLFEFAKESGCKKIVYASSTAVYGAGKTPYRETDDPVPLNAYGRSKLELDKFAMKFASENQDMTVVGLRYCNVYGQGESHKGKMASMALQIAKQMKIGNPKLFKWGEQKRDYIFVKDVVEANLLALEAKKSVVLNCGGG
ncbi:MAG: NAD-dependent epimerase/dehydratase family protein, partial [Candidatus Micrarchaeota archaeon]